MSKQGDVMSSKSSMLTPEQKPRYAALVSEAAGRVVTRGRLYVQGEDGQPRAYSVRLGITDGTATELLVAPGAPEAQALQAGTRVITGTSSPTPAPSRPPAGPRMSF